VCFSGRLILANIIIASIIFIRNKSNEKKNYQHAYKMHIKNPFVYAAAVKIKRSKYMFG